MIQLLDDAVFTLRIEGVIPEVCHPLAEISSTRGQHRGEFTSNLALLLSSDLSLGSNDLANRFVSVMPLPDFLSSIEADGGFINFSLDKAVLDTLVAEILSAKHAFSESDPGHKPESRVTVMLGLGMPAGLLPLNLAPAFALGASVANMLVYGGYTVQRSFYLNDIEPNMNMFEEISNDMNEFGVEIDRYVGGSKQSTAVVNPENQQPDSAFLIDVMATTSDHLLCVMGKDQKQYAERLRRECAGWDSRFEIILTPSVRLTSTARSEVGGADFQPGDLTLPGLNTLRDLRNAVGRDAARYFCLLHHTQSVIDINASVMASRDNLLYPVQSAHVLLCRTLRQAQANGIAYDNADESSASGRPVERHETQLVIFLAHFPEIVATAARTRKPHQVISYLQELANRLNKYYGAQKWLTENHLQTSAQLRLLMAARQVLANGLNLIGVDAPEVL